MSNIAIRAATAADLDRITEIGAAIEHSAGEQDGQAIRERAAELEDFLRRVTVVYD